MADIKTFIRNPDTSSPERADRAQEMADWSEQTARERAAAEGIEMTDDHWEAVRVLRDHYLEHGLPESGRDLADVLADAFDDRGGRRFLYRLFPKGPVTQGMRIAGLPLPAYSEDDGFGTAL